MPPQPEWACLFTREATEREALVNPTPSANWFLGNPGPDSVVGVRSFEPAAIFEEDRDVGSRGDSAYRKLLG